MLSWEFWLLLFNELVASSCVYKCNLIFKNDCYFWINIPVMPMTHEFSRCYMMSGFSFIYLCCALYESVSNQQEWCHWNTYMHIFCKMEQTLVQNRVTFWEEYNKCIQIEWEKHNLLFACDTKRLYITLIHQLIRPHTCSFVQPVPPSLLKVSYSPQHVWIDACKLLIALLVDWVIRLRAQEPHLCWIRLD